MKSPRKIKSHKAADSSLLIVTQVVDEDHPVLGFFVDWIRELATSFDRVEVVCLERGSASLPAHVRVHSLGKERDNGRLARTLNYFLCLRRFLLGREKVGVVFFHMGAILNVLAAPFFMFRGRTRFLWWKAHGHVSLAGRAALICCDQVITPTEESFPVVTGKKRVVGHAVDVALFAPSGEAKPEPPMILMVGRLSPVKRFEVGIALAERLRAAGTPFTMRIVGPEKDAAYAASLRDRIAGADLKDLVSLVGPCRHDDLVEEYRRAAVFLNASETGSLDKVVLEAMACGTPVLAAMPVYRPMLDPCGLWVAGNEADAYLVCLQRLLALPVEAREEIGRRLRGVVVSGHSLGTLGRRIFAQN